MTDELSQLLPFSWRDIVVPTVSLDVEVSHDQPEHKVFGRNAANVEWTGRNSRTFSASIPFYNNLLPGTSEVAISGVTLYPDQYQAFLDAMSDGSSGTLVHPDVGKINCKPKSIRSHWDPTRRDGLSVECSWIESDDSADGKAPELDSPAPITAIQADAAMLDSQLETLTPTPQPADGDKAFPSFTSLAYQVRAVFDKGALFVQRVNGVIDNMKAEVERLQESVDRLNAVNLHPIVDSSERLKSSLTSLRETGQARAALFKRYTVPSDTTMAAIAARLHVDVHALILANPIVAADLVIRAGTIIIYRPTETTKTSFDS